MKKLIKSIGIELEVENLFREDISFERGYSTVRDASCESNPKIFHSVPIKESSLSRLVSSRRTRMGFEIVSSIIDTEKDYLEDLEYITSILIKKGEPSKSFRAGLHVHVNLSCNLEIMKSLIRLGAHFEPLFFMLGTMGYYFRGKLNDCTYFRPITKFGPPCVPTAENKYVQVFNVNDLLMAQDFDEFLYRYGNISLFRERYIPVRYTWLNLVPLFNQGSVEFRIFNKTLNHLFIYAAIEVCKAFVEMAIKSAILSSYMEYNENSIYDVKSKDIIYNLFDEFVRDSSLYKSNRIENILSDIIELGDFDSILLPKIYIYSHLLSSRTVSVENHFTVKGKYKPKEIPKEKIKVPNFVDIHRLEESQ